jgi:ubiquinone/menaquinone biosynthesis C-methylase UbiE
MLKLRAVTNDELKAYLHVMLISIPLFVIFVAVAVYVPGEQIIAKIFGKPEWYFIAVVLCLETLRDEAKAKELRLSLSIQESPAGEEISKLFLVVATALAGFAAYASLGTVVEHAQLRSSLSYCAFIAYAIACARCFFTRVMLLEYERSFAELKALQERGASERLFDAFSKDGSRLFYDSVCGEYNARNANNKSVRATQDAIVKLVIEAARGKGAEQLMVLDVGGGTGDNVRNKLMAVANLKWTSVDISNKMTSAFKQNFKNDEAVDMDFFELISSQNEIMNRRFDLVLFSFSMSSMRQAVEFAKLKNMLTADGQIVVADIHPGYVAFSPKFDIDVAQQRFALLLRRVEPLFLELEARTWGLERAYWDVYKKHGHDSLYSFLLCFRVEKNSKR